MNSSKRAFAVTAVALGAFLAAAPLASASGEHRNRDIDDSMTTTVDLSQLHIVNSHEEENGEPAEF